MPCFRLHGDNRLASRRRVPPQALHKGCEQDRCGIFQAMALRSPGPTIHTGQSVTDDACGGAHGERRHFGVQFRTGVPRHAEIGRVAHQGLMGQWGRHFPVACLKFLASASDRFNQWSKSLLGVS